jgi:nucleoside 2-deoxyribosyltransferase
VRIYLAGPMRGKPQLNRPAFRDGALRLREAGHEVFSPPEYDEKLGLDSSEPGALRKLLGADLAWLCANADAVAVLPGWQESLGASAEVATAFALGIPVWDLSMSERIKP